MLQDLMKNADKRRDKREKRREDREEALRLKREHERRRRQEIKVNVPPPPPAPAPAPAPAPPAPAPVVKQDNKALLELMRQQAIAQRNALAFSNKETRGMFMKDNKELKALEGLMGKEEKQIA